jgi:hypothetical protein
MFDNTKVDVKHNSSLGLTLHSTINLYGAVIEESKPTTVAQIVRYNPRIVNLKVKVMLKGMA